MRTKSFAALGALLLVAAVVGGRYFYSSPAPLPKPTTPSGKFPAADPTSGLTNTPPPLATPSRIANPRSSASNRPETPSVRTMQLGSLPSLDKPLAPQIPALEERAKNGDAGAAVSLWYGLQQCAGLTNGSAEADLNLMKKGYDNDKTARPPDYTGLIHDLLTNCTDVTGPQMDRRYEWLKAAAEQGDPQAQFLYAHGGTEAIGGDMEALRNPRKWEEYRDSVISYTENLVGQCNATAITEMASSYYFGDAYYMPDLKKAYMFRVLSTQVSNTSDAAKKIYLGQLESKMEEDQINF